MVGRVWVLMLTITAATSQTVASPSSTMDLLSDCAETPLTFQTIEETAHRGNISGAVDFIGALPEGTLQTYTFVYDSKSLQSQSDLPEYERPLWPRVLRMSEDGRIIMSYTCNPASNNYNTVEVIHYDDESENFLFTTIDFRKTKERITKPRTCAGCHADPNSNHTIADLRPNIPSYQVWNGWYGSHGDNLKDPRAPQIKYFWQGQLKTASEAEAFDDFREARKDDPCYNTLPKPKNPSPSFAHYPYMAEADPNRAAQLHFEYHLRPNFKFTEVLSRLMAKHIFAKLMGDERFRKARTLLAMEALGGCGLTPDNELPRWLPGYSKQTPMHLSPLQAPFDPRTLESRAMSLYQVGQIVGLQNFDWSMEPMANTPFYNSAMTADSTSSDPAFGLALVQDSSISKVIQGEILNSLAKEDSSLSPWVGKAHGVSQIFGPSFACIDHIASELFVRSKSDHVSLCKALVKKYYFEN